MPKRPIINKRVLMSSAEFFDDAAAINPYMDESVPIDREKAQAEHSLIQSALTQAGVIVETVPAPEDCQDGVYTANWALVRGRQAVLASLPNVRQAETPYAEQELKKLGKHVIQPPKGMRFSGQGDALVCDNTLFMGSTYRTDAAIYDFLSERLGYDQVIVLQTIPKLDESGKPITNKASGWPDSDFYDIDLALAIIAPGVIAWCPEAFTEDSRDKLQKLKGFEKIEVSLQEAVEGFACNLVSTGHTVIMSDQAPLLQSALENRGYKTITPHVTELRKGGGYIRCTTLTI